nr:hypothetical protein [Candidatus Levybacteria bacterium]
MHKDFYASGFLYHSGSGQILLQQVNSTDQNPLWSLFEKKAIKNKTGQETFVEIFFDILGIKLKSNNINSIYTYSSKDGTDYNIYYAEVKRLHKSKNPAKIEFAWFNFKQIQKLNISEQTKQDIMIGQRVIDSSIRKSLGQKTIE